MNINADLQLQILGYVGGMLIIISFIPQLAIIIKNKSSHNVSFGMYIISLIAQILWLIYGILKNDIAIILTNVGTLIITVLILNFALFFKYNKYNSAQIEEV